MRGAPSAEGGGISVVLALAILAIGCAAEDRAPPDFHQRLARLDTVTLIPPRVKVYQITAGGVVEERVAEGAQAARALSEAIEFRIREEGRLRFVEYPPLAEDRNVLAAAGYTPLDENWALFEAVAVSVLLHTYPDAQNSTNHRFPDRVRNFDYTLGPEAGAIVEGLGADAFIFAFGVEHELTWGRLLLEAAAAAAAGYQASQQADKQPQAPVSAPPPPQPSLPRPAAPNHLILALVEARTGDILWFTVTTAGGLAETSLDDSGVAWVMKGLAPERPP
jgi:hypothetical protein